MTEREWLEGLRPEDREETDDLAVVRKALEESVLIQVLGSDDGPSDGEQRAREALVRLDRIEARLKAAEQELENSKADRDAYWSMHEIAGKWEADAERLRAAGDALAAAVLKAITGCEGEISGSRLRRLTNAYDRWEGRRA